MKKRYIRCDLIQRTPDSNVLTRQEKEARIYDLACKMKIKIGKEEDQNVNSKGK